MRPAMLAVVSSLVVSVWAVVPAWAQGSRADYERAAALPGKVRGKVLNTAVRPEWLSPSTFWYRSNLAGGERRYWLVDAEAGDGAKKPLFDHEKVAAALGKASGREVRGARLPIERLEKDGDGFVLMVQNDGRVWNLSAGGAVTERAATERTPFHLEARGAAITSRDGGRNSSITFVNNTGESVKMFWIDAGGVRHPYDRLGPGQSATQNTYSGHAWVAVGHDGKDLGFFRAEARPSIAVIEPKAKTPPPPPTPTTVADG